MQRSGPLVAEDEWVWGADWLRDRREELLGGGAGMCVLIYIRLSAMGAFCVVRNDTAVGEIGRASCRERVSQLV